VVFISTSPMVYTAVDQWFSISIISHIVVISILQSEGKGISKQPKVVVMLFKDHGIFLGMENNIDSPNCMRWASPQRFVVIYEMQASPSFVDYEGHRFFHLVLDVYTILYSVVPLTFL